MGGGRGEVREGKGGRRRGTPPRQRARETARALNKSNERKLNLVPVSDNGREGGVCVCGGGGEVREGKGGKGGRRRGTPPRQRARETVRALNKSNERKLNLVPVSDSGREGCVCGGGGGGGKGRVREGKGGGGAEGYATKAKGQRDSSGVKQIKRKQTEPSPRALSQ